MNIDNSYYSYGISHTYGTSHAGSGAAAAAAQGENAAASFTDCLDKVTLSEEARNKSAQGVEASAETRESITQLYFNQVFGNPDEVEEKTEEWKKQQIIGQSQAQGQDQAEDSPNGDDQAKQAFTQYMDKALGRGAAAVSGGKSPEERIKELTAQIKTLQSRLSEITADASLPETTRASQADAISAKINALHAQISEIAKTLTDDQG